MQPFLRAALRPRSCAAQPSLAHVAIAVRRRLLCSSSSSLPIFESDLPCGAVRVLLPRGYALRVTPSWTDVASVSATEHSAVSVTQSESGALEITSSAAATLDSCGTVDIGVPQRCDLRVELGSGSVEVLSKLEGDVSITVGEGTISVHKVRGESVELAARGPGSEVRVGSAVEAQRVALSAAGVRAKRVSGADVDILTHGAAGVRVKSIYADALRCFAGLAPGGGGGGAAAAAADSGAPPPATVVVGMLQATTSAAVHAGSAGAVVLQGTETPDLKLRAADGPVDVHFDTAPGGMVASLTSEGGGGVRVTMPGDCTVQLELQGKSLRLPSAVANQSDDDAVKGGMSDDGATATFQGLVSTKFATSAFSKSVSPDSSGKIRHGQTRGEAAALGWTADPAPQAARVEVRAPSGVVEFDTCSWIELARRRAEANMKD